MQRPKKPAAKKAAVRKPAVRARVPVTFTIAPALLAEIDNLARQDNRPRSRMIEDMLAEAWLQSLPRASSRMSYVIDHMRDKLIKARIPPHRHPPPKRHGRSRTGKVPPYHAAAASRRGPERAMTAQFSRVLIVVTGVVFAALRFWLHCHDCGSPVYA